MLIPEQLRRRIAKGKPQKGKAEAVLHERRDKQSELYRRHLDLRLYFYSPRQTRKTSIQQLRRDFSCCITHQELTDTMRSRKKSELLSIDKLLILSVTSNRCITSTHRGLTSYFYYRIIDTGASFEASPLRHSARYSRESIVNSVHQARQSPFSVIRV